MYTSFISDTILRAYISERSEPSLSMISRFRTAWIIPYCLLLGRFDRTSRTNRDVDLGVSPTTWNHREHELISIRDTIRIDETRADRTCTYIHTYIHACIRVSSNSFSRHDTTTDDSRLLSSCIILKRVRCSPTTITRSWNANGRRQHFYRVPPLFMVSLRGNGFARLDAPAS